MHVPVNGCVLSPSVEVFRGGSDDGYRFKSEKTLLQAVVSMAMPNKNWHVKDSPVDAPSDPREYEQLVRSKLEATIHAGAYAGADTFVIPDVGCGVFQNDPKTVGKLLGEVLVTKGPYFEEIILTGKEEFMKHVFLAAGQPYPKLSKNKTTAPDTRREGGAGVAETTPIGRAMEDSSPPYPSLQEQVGRGAHGHLGRP
jgi:hypothetical protein